MRNYGHKWSRFDDIAMIGLLIGLPIIAAVISAVLEGC